MKFKATIAQRVAWALTAFVTVVTVLAAGMAFYTHKKMEDRLIDGLVASESRYLDAGLSRGKARWDEPLEREISPVMSAWGEHPSNPAASMPALLRGLDNGIHHIRAESILWHVMVADSLDGKLYVLYDAADHEALARNFGLALFAIALFFIAVSHFMGRRVARWVVSPLQALTDRLEQWAPGSPSFLVARSDEAGRLMEAFNRVQDELDDSIAREREFAANLHHEIRTPLARIRSDSELMLRLPAMGEGESRRLRRIMRSVDDVAESLESTYDIAHAEIGAVQALSLSDCVDDVFARLELEAGNARLELVNSVPADHVAILDRYALLTVMRNLVRNAISHAAPAILDVRSIGGGLAFVDSGPGIAADELPNIFDRYYSSRLVDQSRRRGMPGGAGKEGRVGLGLAIARRVCATHGWHLAVESPVQGGRGTAFHLRFPGTRPWGRARKAGADANWRT